MKDGGKAEGAVLPPLPREGLGYNRSAWNLILCGPNLSWRFPG